MSTWPYAFPQRKKLHTVLAVLEFRSVPIFLLLERIRRFPMLRSVIIHLRYFCFCLVPKGT